MKKFFAVLMSIMLVFTMIPTLAFAEEEQEWYDSCERKEGDLLFSYNYICDIYALHSEIQTITVNAEIQGFTAEEASEKLGENYEGWVYADGVLKVSDVLDSSDDNIDFVTPVAAIVDDIIIDDNTVTYKLSKIEGGLDGEFCGAGVTLAEGEDIYSLYPAIEGHTLTVKLFYYEDKEHTVPLLVDGESYDDVEVISTPYWPYTYAKRAEVGTVIDGLDYEKETNTITINARRMLWNSEDIGNVVSSVFGKYEEVYLDARNLQDKEMTMEYIIYEDDTCTTPIDKDGYSYSEVVPGREYAVANYLAPESIRLIKIIDDTDADAPKLTFCFAPVASEASEEECEVFERLVSSAEDILNEIETDEIHIKIANPDEMGINGYTKDSAKGYIRSYTMLLKELGLEREIYDDKIGQSFETSAFLLSDIYVDKEMTQGIESYDENIGDWVLTLEPNTTYYLDVSYTVSVFLGNDAELTKKIELGRPIAISYEYVSVGENTTEVEQIKKAKSAQINYVIDDLSWINSLITCGFDAYLPSLSNVESFLKVKNNEMYELLVGDTNLDVIIEYGLSGDAFMFIGDTPATCHYYVDDVYYGNSGRDMMYPTQAMYVAEGTDDRAETAENRINNYLGEGSFDANVEKITDPQDMLDLWLSSARSENHKKLLESYINPIRDKVKAAYLTKYGVGFYSDEVSTAKENFLIGWTTCAESKFRDDLFANAGLEEVGTLDYYADEYGYIEETDVKTYVAYKLTLTDTSKDMSHDYLYVIGIGSEAQLEEPYADWKDEETGIVTKGENGYVPFDAYTKIRVIDGGKEIKFIQNKVGNDKVVNAYDINAYTNFKGGKLEDLGDGLMKVMIPLGVLSEDGVKAHYVDDEGNVQDLQYTIEEYEGQKYVCFITNHFSTYAISGVEAMEDNAGGDVENNIGGATDENEVPESIKPDADVEDTEKVEPEAEAPEKTEPSTDTPNTGDNSGIVSWMMLAIVALLGAVTFGRKEMNR